MYCKYNINVPINWKGSLNKYDSSSKVGPILQKAIVRRNQTKIQSPQRFRECGHGHIQTRNLKGFRKPRLFGIGRYDGKNNDSSSYAPRFLIATKLVILGGDIMHVSFNCI